MKGQGEQEGEAEEGEAEKGEAEEAIRGRDTGGDRDTEL